jgi:hypothetical protein
MVKRLISSINEYKVAYITVLIFIIVLVYSGWKLKNVKEDGVVTICYVVKYEPLSDGSNTYCTIYFQGKNYELISGIGSQKMVGKHFFIKILPEDPTGTHIIYEQLEVPACILDQPIPYSGWADIPNCK